jgi:hypothetical protein
MSRRKRFKTCNDDNSGSPLVAIALEGFAPADGNKTRLSGAMPIAV